MVLLVFRKIRSFAHLILTRLFSFCLQAVWEPICWVTGRRWLKDLDAVHRILFIALDNPGDVLLTTPCLRALKERFPSATITVLAGEWGGELLQIHPTVSKVISYNAPWFAEYVCHLPHRPFRPIRDLLQCLSNLWQGRFDLAVETRGEAVHILLAYLSGAPFRVGYAVRSIIPWLKQEGVAHLLTHRVPYPWEQWPHWHRVDFNLRAVAGVGAMSKNSSLTLAIPPRAQEEMRCFLEEYGVRDDTFLIGVHPGASEERKRWPPQHFAKVLDSLLERWDARGVILGSSREHGLARRLASLMTHKPIIAAGETTLLQAATLVQRCQLLICNDSVMTHIASAVKTPVVSLSRSPTNFFAPYQVQGIALSRNLPCINIGYPDGCQCPFSEYWCLQEVTPEEVLTAAEKLLKSHANRDRLSLLSISGSA